MKYRSPVLFRNSGSLIVLIIGLLFHPALQAQNQIQGSVFGNGCAVLSGTSYNIAGTVGQTLCGEMGSSTNLNSVGFWYFVLYRTATAVEAPQVHLPEAYRLHQSYPNPFNPVCVIEYAVPEPSEVTLAVYNVMGKESATLFHGVNVPGIHKVFFRPEQFPSGLYFYRMMAKSLTTGKTFSEVKKATYVK
jgi:hypothetical protein